VDLLATIKNRTTVVTATRQLARHLREQYGRQRLAGDGHRAWPTPDVLPWSSWIEREFQRLRAIDAAGVDDMLVLLRPHQEQKIWEQIIESEVADLRDHVYQIAATARAVAQARRTARNWDIDLSTLARTDAPDARRFHLWNQRFDEYAKKHGLLSQADAVETVQQCIAAGASTDLEQLVHTGFDELSPQQKRVFETYADNGVAVSTLEPDARNSSITRLCFESSQQELDAIADWVRTTLVADPQAAIAVVCPDLNAIRQPLARTVSDALEGNHAASGLVELAIGAPLAEAPMVRAAFAAFSLLGRQVDVDELGLVLTSPFFTDGVSETCDRARLDRSLRARRRKRLSFTTLHYLLVEHDELSTLAPIFTELISSFAKIRSGLIEAESDSPGSAEPGVLSATVWSERLDRFLRHFGWPGERRVSNEEFQVQKAWNDLLTDFCTLDLIVPPMNLTQACRSPIRPVSNSVISGWRQ